MWQTRCVGKLLRCRVGASVDRRSFLGALVGLPAILSIERVAAATSSAAVEVDTFFVAGYQFHAGPSIESGLLPGLELAGRREPTNPHDELAIALWTNDAMVGFVPRRRNGIPARLLDGGFRVRFFVVVVDAEAPPWERLLVREVVER